MIGIDMKMPETCGKCRFATAFDCMANGQFIPDHDKRAPHCPLIPIKDQSPYIVADAED